MLLQPSSAVFCPDIGKVNSEFDVLHEKYNAEHEDDAGNAADDCKMWPVLAEWLVITNDF